jgi:hypothetical protein
MATEGAPFWLQFCFRGMKHVHGFLFTEQSSKLQPVICAYVYTPRLDSINDLACKRDVVSLGLLVKLHGAVFLNNNKKIHGAVRLLVHGSLVWNIMHVIEKKKLSEL